MIPLDRCWTPIDGLFNPAVERAPRCGDCPLGDSMPCQACDAVRCPLDSYPLINGWCSACDAVDTAELQARLDHIDTYLEEWDGVAPWRNTSVRRSGSRNLITAGAQ